MSTTMPRSVLRHRPIHSDVQEWVVEPPRATQRPHPPLRASRLALYQQLHPIALLGLSMLLTFLLLWAWSGIWAWGSLQLDNLRYGDPRVTQLDRAVGHEVGHTLTHFEASNVAGQIYVLEIPGGNPAGSHLLVGPHLIGSGTSLAPVQLHFEGDPAHPDLLVAVAGTVTRFRNTGKAYVPAAP
ncbi:MAG TPA: hypothetical protein VGN34_32010 [Ktedonobacteraceae bacterium]